MQKYILFVLFSAIFSIEAVPKFDQPCKRDDDECVNNISNKIFAEAINGDTSLKIPSLDPLFQDLIEGNLATINYNLHNSTIKGFKKCTLLKSSVSPKNLTYSHRVLCPDLDARGDYDVKGSIISLNVEGNGDYSCQLSEYYINFEGKLNVFKGDDGKDHIALKNFEVTADLVGGVKFYLNNLFGGRKDLSDTFHKVVNDNWKIISSEIAPPVINVLVKQIVKNLNKLLKVIPVDTMYSAE